MTQCDLVANYLSFGGTWCFRASTALRTWNLKLYYKVFPPSSRIFISTCPPHVYSSVFCVSHVCFCTPRILFKFQCFQLMITELIGSSKLSIPSLHRMFLQEIWEVWRAFSNCEAYWSPKLTKGAVMRWVSCQPCAKCVVGCNDFRLCSVFILWFPFWWITDLE